MVANTMNILSSFFSTNFLEAMPHVLNLHSNNISLYNISNPLLPRRPNSGHCTLIILNNSNTLMNLSFWSKE